MCKEVLFFYLFLLGSNLLAIQKLRKIKLEASHEMNHELHHDLNLALQYHAFHLLHDFLALLNGGDLNYDYQRSKHGKQIPFKRYSII